MAFDQDKFFREMMEGMKNFMGEYTERDKKVDLKVQEQLQDVTGNFEFWGIE